MNMRDYSIRWFFIDIRSWRISSYNEQLLVRRASQVPLDGPTQDELVETCPIKTRMFR
jgi:hypothetical protein